MSFYSPLIFNRPSVFVFHDPNLFEAHRPFILQPILQWLCVLMGYTQDFPRLCLPGFFLRFRNGWISPRSFTCEITLWLFGSLGGGGLRFFLLDQWFSILAAHWDHLGSFRDGKSSLQPDRSGDRAQLRQTGTLLECLGFIYYIPQLTLSICARGRPVLWTLPPSERVVQSLYFLQKHPAQPSVSILLVSSQMLFLLPSSNNKKRIWTVKIIKGYGHTVASPNFEGIHNSVLCWSTYIAQSLSKSSCSIPESYFFP